MPITTIHGPNGPITAFVCGRSRAKKCGTCGLDATKLCDFPMENGATCDAGICDACATEMGMGIDYCPKHKDRAPAQSSLFERRG